jgi:superfamily II DNA/RNA helicase
MLTAAVSNVCALQLALEKDLNLKQVKFFVIDECDKVLEKNGEEQG